MFMERFHYTKRCAPCIHPYATTKKSVLRNSENKTDAPEKKTGTCKRRVIFRSPWYSMLLSGAGSILLLCSSDFIFFAFVRSRCLVFLSDLILILMSSPGSGQVMSWNWAGIKPRYLLNNLTCLMGGMPGASIDSSGGDLSMAARSGVIAAPFLSNSWVVAWVSGRSSVLKHSVVLFSLQAEKIWVLCVDPGGTKRL